MPSNLSLILVPGAWHKAICYEKIIDLLEREHKLKCIAVTLPSTTDDPNATFKDDIDAARAAIISETTQQRDVIVIAHSYGGMVGNSAIKGLTRPPTIAQTSMSLSGETTPSGHVVALILIASGFTITGLAFMDPFFGIPPPSWRFDKETGYAVIVTDPRKFFYHDLPADEADYWTSQLTTQSLKALLEGGEHAYAGWMDVPTWYVGTVEDQGMPVVAQRVQIGWARAQGGVVYHTELQSSHSPFLSMPEEVVDVIMEAVETVTGSTATAHGESRSERESKAISKKGSEIPMVKLGSPVTWLKFGLPYLIGRVIGWGFVGFFALRRLWRGK